MRLLILATSTSAFFNLYQLQALYPWLASRFDASLTQAGWLNMAALFGMMLTAPFASRITRNHSIQNSILIGISLLIVLNILLALSPSLTATWFIRMIQGTILPCIVTSGIALLAQAKNDWQRTKWVGYFVAGTILGSTLSRFYPGWAMNELGWGRGFMCCAGLLALLWIITFQQTRKQHIQPKLEQMQAHFFKLLKKAFLERNLIIAYCVGFTLLFTQSSIFTVLGLRLSQAPFNQTSAQIGLIYLACLPAIIAVIASPMLYKSRNELFFFIPFTGLLWISLALAKNDYYLIVISVIGFSVSTYLLQTLTTRMVSNAQYVPAAFASGIYLFFYYAGGAIGAILSALCYSVWSWTGALALIGSTHFTTLLFILILMIATRKDISHTYYLK